jgi:hypothetical protein
MKNDELKVSFALPAPFYLSDIEKWEEGRAQAIRDGAITVVSLRWLAARAIIKDWECETLPDLNLEAKEISDEQLRVIAWVGLQVENFVLDLTRIPKN